MRKTLGEVIKELERKGIAIKMIMLGGNQMECGYVDLEETYLYSISITDLKSGRTVADIACYPLKEEE